MIFIIGTQKSGTTWIRNILDQKLKFNHAAEWYFPKFFESIQRHVTEYHKGSVLDRYQSIQNIVKAGWPAIFQERGRLPPADKSAYPALARAGAQPELFPYAIDLSRYYIEQSKHLLIVRDPRDVFLSSKYHWSLSAGELNVESAEWFAHNWAKCNVHWLRSKPDVVVRYEDMKSHFQTCLETIHHSLGLTLSDDEMAHATREFSTIARSHEKDPVFYRSGMTGMWARELDPCLSTVIWETASEAMQMFGYNQHGYGARVSPHEFSEFDISILDDSRINVGSGTSLGFEEGLRIYVFGEGFYVRLLAGEYPVVQPDQQLLISLEVSWDNPLTCGGKSFRVITASDHETLLHVESNAFLSRSRCEVVFQVDAEVTARDSLTLHLFNGEVQRGFWCTIHRLRFSVTHKGSRFHEQYGDTIAKTAEIIVDNDARFYASRGWSPLHFAVHEGRQAEVELLLRIGIPPNIEERNGATPLHRAADAGEEACLELLLDAGANVNAIDRDRQETPLDVALNKKNIEIGEILKRHGGYRFNQLYKGEEFQLPDCFNPAKYLLANPDVEAAGVDAQEHFLRYGRFEGRRLWPYTKPV